MNVEKTIEEAMSTVEQIVTESTADSRTVIARYTAAIAVNFTEWMGRTLPWTRHEFTKYVLTDNLRCEITEDHTGMLFRFAENSGIKLESSDYAYTKKEIANIRIMLSNPNSISLSGTALCAVLENTSLVFIPDLAKKARECGCSDFTYTVKHGEADTEHSNLLILALNKESRAGHCSPEATINVSATVAVDLIRKIYS